MVKINTKKKMNLIELINWAFENDVHCKSYITNDEDGNVSEVTFDVCGIPRFSSMVSKEDTFTVEVEEEITKETELPKYLEIYAHKSLGYGDENISIGKNQSIKEILKENKKYSTITKAIHLINDDGTHTLIWKDGELVGDE